MKIKDILSPVLTLKDKYILAHRLRKCTDLIKSDIRQWKETGEIPNRLVVLEAPMTGTGKMTLSIQDLVDIYSLDLMDAFIFMDDILWADAKDDKKELVELLGRLKSVGCVHNANVNDELLEHIRLTQPGVWESYQKLMAQQEVMSSEIESEDPLNEEF